jgi:hypothetical protein
MNKAFLYGLDIVDWTAPDYPNWDGRLASCCRDAASLYMLACTAGWSAEMRMSRWAGLAEGMMSPYVKGETTRTQWEADWESVFSAKPGDSFFFGYSGHGYRNPYVLKSEEGLCFFDGLYPDRKMYEMYSRIPEGVNVVCWFDCCHAGGLNRAGLLGASKNYAPPVTREEEIQPRASINGNVLLLCACQANETAMDGPVNGAFTGSMLSRLKRNWPLPTWVEWFENNSAFMAASIHLRVQTPMYSTLGGGQSLLRRPAFT